MTDDKWVIIGQPNCPWCDKARLILNAEGIAYTYFDHYILSQFLRACDLKTVPQVYRNGHLIGGYEETKEFIEWMNS